MNSRQQLHPKKILVIALRYLGDVLLTTPLIHSLRQAYPDAEIDVLVYVNTAGILEGNPDVNRIITTPNRPAFKDYVSLLKSLFRQYDLAFSTQPGDRPLLYTLLASPFRIAAVPPKNKKGWWKRLFMQSWVEFDDENTHTVLQHLKLLDSIGVSHCYGVVPPSANHIEGLRTRFPFLRGRTKYAVLHTHPQWTYKQWTVEGWIKIGRLLKEMGLIPILSGGAAPQEIEYVTAIQKQLPNDTLNLAGQVTLGQLAEIIAGAELYVGPDTGITHLAAATGVPVVALYGPTNPVKWAPWPSEYNSNNNPFEKVGSRQLNNIHFIQGLGDCVPCHLEGCDRHRQSRSRCLDTLTPDRVESAIRLIVGK